MIIPSWVITVFGLCILCNAEQKHVGPGNISLKMFQYIFLIHPQSQVQQLGLNKTDLVVIEI